jgi:hypothetical protein
MLFTRMVIPVGYLILERKSARPKPAAPPPPPPPVTVTARPAGVTSDK